MRRITAALFAFIILCLSPMAASAMGESINVGFVSTPGFSYYKLNGQMAGYAIAWFSE